MSFAIKTEIKGLDGLLKKTKLLKNPVKAQQNACRRGGRVILKAAKPLCPEDTDPHLSEKGLLRKSLGVIVKVYKKVRVIALIGPRRGFRRQVGTVRRGKRAGLPIYQDPAKIAHLVEYGHGGPHPAPPKPFLRPATDSSQSAVVNEMAESLKQDLGVLLG